MHGFDSNGKNKFQQGGDLHQTTTSGNTLFTSKLNVEDIMSYSTSLNKNHTIFATQEAELALMG